MSTINKKEIQKFSKIANEWWDPEGKFKPLHKFNPVRIKYIKNYIYIPIRKLNNKILSMIKKDQISNYIEEAENFKIKNHKITDYCM